MSASLIKSILHNIGVIAVGFAIMYFGKFIDQQIGVAQFYFLQTLISGIVFIVIGFLIRVWATVHFYEKHMKVIVLEPQHTLITTGPFRFSRNPLYLGGNVFIFLGAALILGSPSAIMLTSIGIFATNIMIKREEKQLELRFGHAWIEYKRNVRRWI